MVVTSSSLIIGRRRAWSRARERKRKRITQAAGRRKLFHNGSGLINGPVKVFQPLFGFNLIKINWRLDDQSHVDTSRGRALERLASDAEKHTDRQYPFNEGNSIIPNTHIDACIG